MEYSAHSAHNQNASAVSPGCAWAQASQRIAAAPTVCAVLQTLVYELQRRLPVVAASVRVDRRRFDADSSAGTSDAIASEATDTYCVGDVAYQALGNFDTDAIFATGPQANVLTPHHMVYLQWNNAIIGDVRLWSQHSFSAESEASLQDFLAQAAIALWRSHRYEQLRNAKRQWEEVFDGMLDGVCLCSQSGIVLRANRALASLTGRPVEQLIGLPHDTLFPGATHAPSTVPQTNSSISLPIPDAPSTAFLTSAANEHSSKVEFPTTQIREFRVPEAAQPGSSSAANSVVVNVADRIFLESIFPLRGATACTDADGLVAIKRREVADDAGDFGSVAHHVCIIREITSQRRLQEQLVQSEKLAALGELVSGVAHELNNPLTTVVGYAQLLETDERLPAQLSQSVRLIGQEAQRAAQIVGNLLSFARASQPEKSLLAADEVLLATLKLCAYQLKAENIEAHTHFAPNLPPVWGDPLQLQQVFLNIINNAAQAMVELRRGGTLRIETLIVPSAQSRLESGCDALRISFRDNGPGIAPEDLRRVFDPFFTTKGLGHGTGLGLSISYGIVANHNGTLWAESQPGYGAHFCVDLPMMLPMMSAQAPQSERISPSIISEARTDDAAASPLVEQQVRKILVIDDEEPVVMLITEILGLDGHQITPAYNGAEALALLHTQPFDLIISDVRMPAVGGPTFFEMLQTTRPDVLPRVLFVTGDTVSPSTQSFLQQAGRPLLSKPFNPDRLRQMVAQCLAQTSS
ncbi:MAG: two-component system, NtrC family, sensor kinase [Abditibacteriota bacterium]|nr:two-component system, NtrC family, sensor kinase [Abditibacteriota bacterium]